MKKIYATKSKASVVPQHRAFRRFVRKVFASFLKRQSDDAQTDFQAAILQKLKGIENRIESMAREMIKPARSKK